MGEVSSSPPKTLKEKWKLILTPRAGALYGLSIAWVILLSVVYKLFLTLGLARSSKNGGFGAG